VAAEVFLERFSISHLIFFIGHLRRLYLCNIADRLVAKKRRNDPQNHMNPANKKSDNGK